MVRINRVHGFRERLHQLKSISNPMSNHPDCIMYDGSCECVFIDQCKYIGPDADVESVSEPPTD